MAIARSVPAFGAVAIGSIVSIYTGINTGQEIIVFNFEGSASMKPIMEFLMRKYSAEKAPQRISFNISTIGSNAGLKKLLDGDSDFALVSHDISHFPTDDQYKNKWEEKKLKTITLATESMALLYKPPKGCNKDLILSKNNVKKLYSVFSGFNAPDQKETIDFNSLLDEQDDKCKAEIHAWVKSTGPVKSGTAKAFVDNPLFKDVCVVENGKEQCNPDCGEWCRKVKDGYGNEYKLNYVPEPTNLHWDSFRSNLREGSMTYLPSNFVFQNWDEIAKLGIKLAKYKKKDESEVIAFEKGKVETVHEWTRSYNIVYSTENLSSRTNHKSLLEFFVVNSRCLSELKMSAKTYTLASGSNDSSCSSNTSGDSNQIDVSKPDNTSKPN